jgi:hypothetical protein
MSEPDRRGSVDDGAERAQKLVNRGRRDVLTSFAKYTAPAMLAVLMSVEKGGATPCVSNCQ